MINPRAILLDMGGVLLDVGGGGGLPYGRSDWRGREALVRLIQNRGGRRLHGDDLEAELFAPWRREYEKRMDSGREASWEPHLDRLRSRAGLDADTAPSVDLLRAWFQPVADSFEALPGAVAAVRTLAASGRKLALVSNVPLPGALYRGVLARLGLESSFDSLHFSYDAGSRKPSPAMLRSALDALGVRPGEAAASTVPRGAVMVGDRRAVDVVAGRAAGLTTVWIRCEYADGPAANYEIDRLEELSGLLTELPSVFGALGPQGSGR